MDRSVQDRRDRAQAILAAGSEAQRKMRDAALRERAAQMLAQPNFSNLQAVEDWMFAVDRIAAWLASPFPTSPESSEPAS